jgi:hypothetical protein
MTTFLKCLFYATLAALVITAPALWRAHADPQDAPYIVCGALAADPTTDNVLRVLQMLESAGNTRTEAAGLVADAVNDTCPRYRPVVEAFINRWTPKPTPVAPVPGIAQESIA